MGQAHCPIPPAQITFLARPRPAAPEPKMPTLHLLSIFPPPIDFHYGPGMDLHCSYPCYLLKREGMPPTSGAWLAPPNEAPSSVRHPSILARVRMEDAGPLPRLLRAGQKGNWEQVGSGVQSHEIILNSFSTGNNWEQLGSIGEE